MLAVAAFVACFVFPPTGGSATPGLVAAFAFDEGTGSSIVDASGSGNNGTTANTTWAATGKYGKALSFNGTSSRVTIADAASLHLTGSMTLEAWVSRSGNKTGWRDLVYKGDDNYYLSASSSPNNRPAGGGIMAGSSGEVFGTARLPASTWTHLAVTYDGTTIRLYVNGAQVSSLAKTGNLTTSTNPLTIGSDPIYGQYFQGMIDDVRVYNVALTSAQIQTDMATPVAAVPDTVAAVGAGDVDGVGDQQRADRSELGCGDRQRCRGRVSDRALYGGGLFELRADCGAARHRHHVQRYDRGCEHELQLPRAGGRRGSEPRLVLEYLDGGHARRV